MIDTNTDSHIASDLVLEIADVFQIFKDISKVVQIATIEQVLTSEQAPTGQGVSSKVVQAKARIATPTSSRLKIKHVINAN